jgi:ATP-dependent DNA ligase
VLDEQDVGETRCSPSRGGPLPWFDAPPHPRSISGHAPAARFRPAMPANKGAQPPTGGAWLHEIKHDRFRVVARKDGDRVRLYSRRGNDVTWR